ncbi:MAG: exodeoxyribonuclease VII large subunit, partial [Terricaulis sp.]
MSDAAAATTAQSNLPELSVSELASAVKRTMETNFDRVRVRGELGRVLIAKSGHLYVDLKDEGATISTVMWKANVQQLGFKPEEGLEVVAEGRLSTYPARSQYQLLCERMAPAGVGALLAQLEKLKQKLQGEGLFARERKKPIPYLPRTIGVVTSPTGAVIRDILHRLGERFPCRVI